MVEKIVMFFNSQFFTGFATILTGAVAIYVFYRQQSDEKMKAARVIIDEIRNAEEKIAIISEKLNSNSAADLPTVLPTNNWRTNAHLFVTKFDYDELQHMNSFYTSCEIIHDAATRNNNHFWITTEERARAVQRKIAETNGKATPEELNEISNHTYTYSPQKTLDLMNFHIRNFQKVTVTSCGTKLKKIARLKD